MEKALQWMYSKEGRVTYSMEQRNGPSSYDCSSSVYHALKHAGIFPSSMGIGNTDSLFGHLEKNGFTRLPKDGNGDVHTRRGDIFIWGKRGASGGAAGHTGMFVDDDNIINCRWGRGMVVDNHDWLWAASGSPEYEFYRYTGRPAPSHGIERGDIVVLPGTYKAEAVEVHHGIKQIKVNDFYKGEFDWGDNGIPAVGLNRVDNDGYRIDGDVEAGDKFRILGSHAVVDVMEDGGTSYALLNMSGEQVWIQVGALKELKPGEPGIPDAPKRPLPQPVKETTPEAKPQPLAPQPQLEVLERLGKIEEQGKKNNALLQFIIDVLKAVFRVK